LPARHVRPHRADATATPPVRARARGRVARCAELGRPQRLLVVRARRVDRARRVPRAGLRQRRVPARRCESARRRHRRLRARLGGLSHRTNPLDERHRPPGPAAKARAARRGSERDPGRLRADRDLARRPPRACERRRPAVVDRRTAFGRACEPAHGGHLEPGRRAPGGGACRARARAGRDARRAVPGAGTLAGRPAARSMAAGGAQRGARLDLRVLHRRGVRRRPRALPEAARIGEGLAQRALDALGASVAGDAPVAVNPTARTRSGLVEIVVPGEGPRPGAQILSERPAERVLTELDLGSMAGVVVRELKHNRRIEAIALESVDTGEELWRAERERDGSMLDAGTRAELDALAASNAGTVRIKIRTKPTQKLVVRMTDVPGHGWRCWEPAPLDVAPVDAGGSTMTNGLVRVEVAADG